MTKAYIISSERGVADELLLKLFSYHKRNGTTLEHYVNHNEALAILTDNLKNRQDWSKTIYPDEIKALDNVIKEYRSLIDAAPDDNVRERLTQELAGYEQQMIKLKG